MLSLTEGIWVRKKKSILCPWVIGLIFKVSKICKIKELIEMVGGRRTSAPSSVSHEEGQTVAMELWQDWPHNQRLGPAPILTPSKYPCCVFVLHSSAKCNL